MLFADSRSDRTLEQLIETTIEADFGFPVKVVLRDLDAIAATARAIRGAWKDDATMRCYVMFLRRNIDESAVLDRLTIKQGIDHVRYVPGAVIWRVDKVDLTRSGMMRLPSDDLYQSMTIRNCNTVRKLHQLMTTTA